MAEPRPEVLRRVLETERTEIHTSKPARVQSYDRATQTVNVHLGVRNVLPSGDDDTPDTIEAFPILAGVPVAILRAGGFFVHVPITEGTTGSVFFSDTDINAWRAGDGGPVDPGVPTRHGLSGAFFVPGLHTRSGALVESDCPAGAMRLGREGSSVVVEITSSEIKAGGSLALAEADDVKTHLQAIAGALDTLAGLLSTTSSYVYGTTILTAPIATSVLKGT